MFSAGRHEPIHGHGAAHHPSTSHHSVMQTQINTHVQIPALCMSTPRHNRCFRSAAPPVHHHRAPRPSPSPLSIARSDTRSEKNETTEPAPHHHQGERKRRLPVPSAKRTTQFKRPRPPSRALLSSPSRQRARERKKRSVREEKKRAQAAGPRTVCNLCFALDFTTKRYAYL